MELESDECQPQSTSCNFHPQTGHLKTLSQSENISKFLKDQIEFYFSDSNLLKDTKLNQLLLKNRKGYLHFRLLLKFNRVRNFLKEMSVAPDTFYKTIASALSTSTFLQVNKIGNMVKRKVKLDKTRQNLDQLAEQADRQSIYADGFDPQINESVLFDSFSSFGIIKNIHLPKWKSGISKGFCFIEFSDGSAVAKSVRPSSINTLKAKLLDEQTAHKLRVLTKLSWLANETRTSEVT